MPQNGEDIELQLEPSAGLGDHITDQQQLRRMASTTLLQEVSSCYWARLPQRLLNEPCYIHFKEDGTKEGSNIFRSLQIADFRGDGEHLINELPHTRGFSSVVDEYIYGELLSRRFRAVIAENVTVDDIFVLGAALNVDPYFIAQHIRIYYRSHFRQDPMTIGVDHEDLHDSLSRKEWLHLNAQPSGACLTFSGPPFHYSKLPLPLISIYRNFESSCKYTCHCFYAVH